MTREKKQLNFNSPAPDLVLHDSSGKPVQLSSLWAEKPLLLAFTRHFGCTQCKEMLAQLAAGREAIQNAGLELAVVMQAEPLATAEFAAKYAPGLLALADPDRKAYRAFGLERGSLFQTFLNRKVWKAIRQARRKGYKVEQPPRGQDAMQMSGTFIISPEGRIELPYYYDNIADHPPLQLILEGVLDTQWAASFEGPVGPGVKNHHDSQGRDQ